MEQHLITAARNSGDIIHHLICISHFTHPCIIRRLKDEALKNFINYVEKFIEILEAHVTQYEMSALSKIQNQARWSYNAISELSDHIVVLDFYTDSARRRT